jgi:hypothetical protein
MIRLTRTRLTVFVAIGLLLTSAGCAAQPVDLQYSSAEQFQAQILDISEAAAAADFTSAQALLTALQQNLRTAAAAGQVSSERSATIQASINLVNADLTAEIEAAAQAAAQAAADAAAEAAQQNAEDTTVTPQDDKQAAEDARDAEKEAAKAAKEAHKECLDDKERAKAGECD